MEYTGCYNSAIELIEEASWEFGNRYILNDAKYNSLKYICEAVDNLVDEIDCESVDVSVNKATKQFTIEVVCDEVVLEHGRNNGFFKLIQMLNSFSFSKKGREFIRIALNIDNMWE